MWASPLPSDLEGQLALLDLIIESQEHGRVIARYLPLGDLLFGESRITGPQVWPELAALAEWCRERAVGP